MLSALKYDERFPSTDMFGDMESEIAELRTMTRVTKLRRQIETRQEGAWMTVRDVPDDRSSSGTRKVTTYGRATRSVTRSFTSDVNLNDFLSSTTTKDNFKEPSNEAIVEFPEELPRSTHQPPKSDVEITEVVDNEPEPTYGVPIKTSPTKKTSVVTLGQGNVVLIDPQDSNFKVTGMSKGVVGEEPSSKSGVGPKLLSKSEDSKKVKKVGFCKTEVHFAPDSGKVNIVETDEKPPSSQVLRRKKKPRKEPQKTSMPKLYFGDMEKHKISAEKSVLIDPGSRTEHVFPVIREPSPLLSTSIANQARSVKEPWSSPKKDDINYCELSGSEVKTKIGFNSNSEVKLVEKSVPKPSFNGSWSKEGADFVRNVNLKDDSNCELGGYAEVKGKISFSSNSEVKSVEKSVHLDESDSKAREFNGNWCKEGASFLRNVSPKDDADFELSGYGEVERKISFNSNSEVKSVEKSVPLDESVPKQFNGSWSKEGANFLRNVSPKLSKLISNNMQHEFQQKQMEILRKSRKPEQQGIVERGIVEPGIVVVGGSGVVEGDVPVAVNIHVSSDESQMKVKPVKIVAQVKVSLEERKAKAGPEPKREPVYVNEVKGVTRTINVSREEEKTPKPKSSLTKIVLEEGKERKRTKSITKSATLERVGRKSTTPVRESRPKKDVPKREVAVVKPMKPAKGTLTRPEPCRRARPASDGLRPLKAPKDPTKPRGDKTEPAKSRGDKVEPAKSRGDKADSAKSKKSKEPLRSFEKVSNGWVSHIVPVKAAKGSSRVNITTTTASTTVATSAQSVLTSSTNPEMKSDTESSELRNPVTVRVENKFHTRSSLTSAKQFSLSKEHLKSAKLVKDLYRVRSEPKPDVPLPKSQSQRPKPEDWASQRSKSIVSRRRLVYEEGPRHVRRDSEQSDDSVIRADEEVRAYMFNSKTKNVEC